MSERTRVGVIGQRRNWLAVIVLCPALVVAACGGTSTIIDGAGDGGSLPRPDAEVAPTSDGGSCSVSGMTYANGATGIPASDGCNQCTCNHGQLGCTLLGCAQPKTCGGLLARGCAPGEYCEYAVSAHCGAGDQTGLCSLQPDACPDNYAPVCGCNRKTYPNGCGAASVGISVVHSGECNAADGACFSNAMWYPDGSTGIPAGPCSECACAAGKLACQPTCAVPPDPPKPCGARAGNTCAATEYCAYAPGSYCGAADAEALCQPRPEVCDTLYAPVCGCDGKTYPSACDAARAGQGYASSGACP